MVSRAPVLICGGGIGGLAMANCLQRVNIPFKVRLETQKQPKNLKSWF